MRAAYWGRLVTVKWLAEAGANINTRGDNDGWTAVMRSAMT